MDDCIAEELEVKLARVRAYMRERGLDVLILRRFDNFAWITAGGDNRCAGATDVGAASVLVTPDDQWVLTSSVEEEIPGGSACPHLGRRSFPDG